MTSEGILIAYAIIALADMVWGIFLTVLNYRHAARVDETLPPELALAVSPEERQKSIAYSRARMRLSFVVQPVMTVFVIAAAAVGFFGFFDRIVAAVAAGAFLQGAIFLGGVGSSSALVSIPASLYSTFVLEKRFGFNTTSLRIWLLDALKGAALSVLFGLPLLWLLFTFMDAAGGLWWLWAVCAFSLFNIVMSILYPIFLAPLFNKFSVLPEGNLAVRIRALAEALDFKMSGIFVMDGSKRSKHSNAYFTGIGRARRIVLYDTLIQSMSEDEVLAVLAHEIGHAKKRHVLKGTILSVLLSFVGFWMLSLLRNWQELYSAFGFAHMSNHAILLIFALVSGPATFFLTPAFSAWSRSREREADRFAAGAAGAGAMASALVRLNRENASNLSPHPLYSFWYYSHPILVERLAVLRRYEEDSAPESL